MAVSVARFLFGFSVVSLAIWIFFKLLPWILHVTVGATVSFRTCGWNCLKDVVVKLKKGSMESISIGEIKLSLCQSLVELCVGIFIRDPKLLVSICDLKVVIRSSNSRKGPRKTKTQKPRTTGRGKLIMLANIARFFSVSMTNMVVKTSKATTEAKELELDISKYKGSANFLVKLYILPIFVQIGESQVISDHLSKVNDGRCISASQASFGTTGSSSPSFYCEKFSLSCEFSHDRQSGVSIKNVEVSFGDVDMSLNEKFLSKSKTSSEAAHTDKVMGLSLDSAAAEKPQKQPAIVAISNHASNLPEKVFFNLSKLDCKFVHQEHGFVVENNIVGFQLKSTKSRTTEDVGESTCVDVLMEFNEIHILREAGTSVLEIIKVDAVSKVYFPILASSPIRAEVEIKLGGTVCNIISMRFMPLVRLHFSKKKKMVLQEETPTHEKPRSTDSRAIMWRSTIVAPEMTVVLYSLGNSPLYCCRSQSLHVNANNISGIGSAVQMELGELNLHMAAEIKECLKENLFGIESSSGSLINVGKVRLDWGKKDGISSGEDGLKSKLGLSVDVSRINMYFSFKRVESLILNAMPFKALIKSLSGSGIKTTQKRRVCKPKSLGKGAQLLKFNVESCSLNFFGDIGLDKTIIEDPKRVNYGSQGGRVVISVSADGTPRTASIMSTISEDGKKLNYSMSFEIFQFSFTLNKEKQSTQVELERTRSIYQEYLEENQAVSRVTLFDIQNAKFVRRNGGLKEIAICSLFSASNITVRWEPDAHISIVELVLRLKSLIYSQNLQQHGDEQTEDAFILKEARQKEEETTVSASSANKYKKNESIFAVDVEMLSISAEAGDGVEAEMQVQSIFSENAHIGILFEGLIIGFCGSRIFKTCRMQISRIPCTSLSNAAAITGGPWDWVIQGLDIHICMPFRLQLRAIDDAVEEMLRALKLIITAKTKLILPLTKESSKSKKSSSKKFGRVRFCIRKLIFDIEEESIQGWLDEHYHLMKKEAHELAVRLKFLDEFISRGNQHPKSVEADNSVNERKICFDGTEIDAEDPSIIQMMKEKIYKQSFHSYYKACQSLVTSEGSGACKEGFQAGFKPSAVRTSLLSVSTTDFDLSLTAIDGGDAGMMEVLKKLDPVCRENDIPFSRLYGSNIQLNIGTLVVQLRNYTFPLLSATSGKCEGRIVLAQQATCFQPQIVQDVYIGRWRKVQMLRSASGTTPPMKTYSELPIYFQKGEVSFGVGYEPVLADISYAFTVALRRANLSLKGPGLPQPPKKERSLPWWDEIRNYIHGNITLFFSESKWIVLATPDPYEKLDKLQMTSASMEIQQSDGRVFVFAKDIKIFMSSLESLANRYLKFPASPSGYPILEVPNFSLKVAMDWDCDSGTPLNHFLFALPYEGKPREKVYDPFRSTSLSLCWDFSFRPEKLSPSASKMDQSTMGGTTYGLQSKLENLSVAPPKINIGAHDLAWLVKFWNMNYLPPYKLRTFSRWPRFGVPRIPRSGNLSLDRVMIEFMLRIDITPICIKHMPLDTDDPAKALTFDMKKLKYENFFSRGKQKFTFECKRDTLDSVYQGLDLHMPKAFLNRDDLASKTYQMMRTSSHSGSIDRVSQESFNCMSVCPEKHPDDGFVFFSDYFTIRRQAPKADPERLLAWKEAGMRNHEMTDTKSAFDKGGESDEHTQSDPSDDDGYSVVIADNCQRIFVYGLKLLWNIENRDVVLSFVGGMSKAFQPPKPSPSRQYAQRKLLEENQKHSKAEVLQEDPSRPRTSESGSSTSQHVETQEHFSSSSDSVKVENSTSVPVAPVKNEISNDSEEEGTRHFMVNIIEPQFNLHSEEANGRFLLAAASGRVLARSFHSVVRVGYEMIEHATGNENNHNPDIDPEMTWTRMESSVMLEHVQAHVAPTDVDPGAGVQWLPKIRRSSPQAKRTGALLERVFMPCDMYFQYTRHKGVTPDLKVKPLKELTFNSHNITASMTSRQFQVMLDVLTNLLFARLPKPRKSCLSYHAEDDDDVEEEIDEVVPDGVEEVELAKIDLEQRERERMSLLDDIRKLSQYGSTSGDLNPEKEGDFWMITGGRSILVQGLKKVLVNAQISRKSAYAALRTAVQKAAELRLLDKDKKQSPSSAMRISLQIRKAVWSMLLDGKIFSEVEIDNMIYDFDRDYKDIGVAQFTTRYFVLRNCLPNAKSDTVLSAWNPPPEWGKKVMLRVDAKQGSPRGGQSPIELFQVEIYPLKIHLMETMYSMMWEYLFPGEEQHSQRREEIWKVSTTVGSRRGKKGSSIQEVSGSSHSTKDGEGSSRSGSASFSVSDLTQASKIQNPKSSIISSSGPELRRTSSFDRTWEETVAESVANELILSSIEQENESSTNKLKDSRSVKSGRSANEEKKVEKSQEEKKSRPRKIMEFHNIKISQVELLITYEGSRFAVSDLKLLMDTFHRSEFTGTWRRLFSRVRKHIIWGVLKSVTGMQVKKFKDKAHGQQESPENNLALGENDQAGKSDQYPTTWVKRPGDGAGDGFVTSIKGLFNTQRRKAKKFVLRTMRGEADNSFPGEWSDNEADFSPFARQLTITKAKQLIRRHSKKFQSNPQKGSMAPESLPSTSQGITGYESDSSSGSSAYEEFFDQNQL